MGEFVTLPSDTQVEMLTLPSFVKYEPEERQGINWRTFNGPFEEIKLPLPEPILETIKANTGKIELVDLP